MKKNIRREKENNYAFIDSQNLYLSVTNQGWELDYKKYDKAIIISGDGDFCCLIKYLVDHDKLIKLLIPNKKRYSSLLRKFNKYISFISDQKKKLEYKK